MSKQGVLADAPELLRRAAEKLDSQVRAASPLAPQPAPSLVRIIRDQEHETKMRELLFSANRRCLVISNKLGAKAAIRLAPLIRDGKQKCENISVQYSKRTLSAPTQEELDLELKAIKTNLKRVPSRHSKVIVADNAAIVSSYNFLSADPFGNFFNAREVGVLIEGGSLPDILWTTHLGS